MHLPGCPLCGHADGAPEVRLFSEADITGDLPEQIRQAPPEVAPLLRSLRDRLRIRGAASDQLRADLQAIVAQVVEELRKELAAQGDLRSVEVRRAIAAITLDYLEQILIDAGIPNARANLERAQGELAALNVTAAETAAGLPAGTLRLDVFGLQTLVTSQADAFWKGKVVTPAASLISDMLGASMSATRLEDLTARIGKQLDTTVARASAEAVTKLATFDRTAGEEAAQAAGLDLRIYMGPQDGITRPFCGALVGKVLTTEQIAELDNGQTPEGVIFSAGGYRCRHSWLAISESTVARRRLPLATASDIAAANAGGRR